MPGSGRVGWGRICLWRSGTTRVPGCRRAVGGIGSLAALRRGRRLRDPSKAGPMPDTLRERLQAALGSHYTLERELSGGMSRVFVATEAALGGRRVVIKVLPPERT